MEVENPSTDCRPPYLIVLPTEILFNILEFLPPKELVLCRRVCTRWRDVIDTMCKNSGLWESFCRNHYEKFYKEAKSNSIDRLSWFEVYRSLSLWPNLEAAQENIDEFCHCASIDYELINVVAQPGGNLMVHKRTRIEYYDARTLEVARRKGFPGQYSHFIELEDVAIMLEFNARLHIVNKPKHDWTSNLKINTYHDDEVVSNRVRSLIVLDRMVYFWKYYNNIFYFHLDNDIEPTLMLQLQTPIAAMGYVNNCWYILTSENYYMYQYSHSTLLVKFTFEHGSTMNLMDCLYQHNMLETMDWRLYYIMRCDLGYSTQPTEPQFICKIHIYRDDLFFVGIQTGRLNIYYKPITNGVFDLCEHPPIRTYNFSERNDIPILSVFPVINITVLETKDGHKVFVCMPRKIIVITYKHTFDIPISKAVLPYVEMPRLA